MNGRVVTPVTAYQGKYRALNSCQWECRLGLCFGGVLAQAGGMFLASC
jgi:hypothetical protein